MEAMRSELANATTRATTLKLEVEGLKEKTAEKVGGLVMVCRHSLRRDIYDQQVWRASAHGEEWGSGLACRLPLLLSLALA